MSSSRFQSQVFFMDGTIHSGGQRESLSQLSSPVPHDGDSSKLKRHKSGIACPSMSGSPPSFSDYLYFYSFMDRNVHAHFYRQPISIDCQVLFIFFFSGRLCRNRYCTFLDFQNRFDKVCRIVFRFVHRPLADSFRRNLLQNGNASAFPDFSVSFKT